jgi:hypothetical protein
LERAWAMLMQYGRAESSGPLKLSRATGTSYKAAASIIKARRKL